MDIASNLPKFVVVAVLIGGVAILTSKWSGGTDEGSVVVNIPSLSVTAVEGKGLFDENCAACHGKNAAGSDQGPTFIHPVYRPNHHGDQSFVLAALRGVRAHHWKFGNMPKQPQVNPTQVLKIVKYVRELQRANGVH